MQVLCHEHCKMLQYSVYYLNIITYQHPATCDFKSHSQSATQSPIPEPCNHEGHELK